MTDYLESPGVKDIVGVKLLGANSQIVDSATFEEQQAQSVLLNDIKNNTTGLVKNDKEIPFVWFSVKQAFTDVTVDDIVVCYSIINTETGVGTPYTKRWRGWLDVTVPAPIFDYLVFEGGNAMTFAQFQLVFGNTSDSAASTDTGTFTLLAFVKRLLTKIPVIGQQTGAESRSVVQASDSVWISENATRQLVSGSITTQNLNPTGAATPGSAVEIDVNTDSVLAIQASGVYTGQQSIQGTLNGDTWDTLGGTPLLKASSGAYSSTITSAATGIYYVNCAGLKKIRVTALAAVTGTLNLTLKTVPGNNSLGNIATLTTLTTGNVQNIIPGVIADVAGALTTTTTTSAFTPTFGQSYKIVIPVTAVSGTNPNMDVDIQESPDNGTNWKTVASIKGINAVGIWESEVLPLTGNRIRYVQTVTGTTPSITRSIIRNQINAPASPLVFNSVSNEAENGRVVKNKSGVLLGVSGYNSKTSDQFILLFNSATAPADGAVPVEIIKIFADSNFSFEPAGLSGDNYNAGIYICNSSTAFTKTIGAADCFFNVRYR